MTHFIIQFALIALLAGFNGTNPFDEEEAATTTSTTDASDEPEADDTKTETTETTTDTGDPISSNRTILPGTANSSANDAIFRREASTGDDSDTGNGFAQGFAYDSVNDTFTVDNIAFDGEGPYTAVRDSSNNRFGIGPFSVFENEATVADGLTAGSINQMNYRALYGVGPDGNTSIAIVCTGAYIEYGFGGYLYQRNGGVTLPTSGQALYTGSDNYGGLRDFLGQGGLEYVNGDMEVRIDFNDFNEGAGVNGLVTNRQIFDLDGNDVTSDILTAFGAGTTQLPVLRFVIEPGVLDSNGELTGTVRSNNPSSGDVFEEGNCFAVLSGDDASTITGVVVVTSDSPRYGNSVTVRETAGFFAVRE